MFCAMVPSSSSALNIPPMTMLSINVNETAPTQLTAQPKLLLVVVVVLVVIAESLSLFFFFFYLPAYIFPFHSQVASYECTRRYLLTTGHFMCAPATHRRAFGTMSVSQHKPHTQQQQQQQAPEFLTFLSLMA